MDWCIYNDIWLPINNVDEGWKVGMGSMMGNLVVKYGGGGISTNFQKTLMIPPTT